MSHIAVQSACHTCKRVVPHISNHYLHVWHDSFSFTSVPWLIYSYDMSHAYEWVMARRITMKRRGGGRANIQIVSVRHVQSVPWLIHCDTSHPYTHTHTHTYTHTHQSHAYTHTHPSTCMCEIKISKTGSRLNYTCDMTHVCKHTHLTHAYTHTHTWARARVRCKSVKLIKTTDWITCVTWLMRTHIHTWLMHTHILHTHLTHIHTYTPERVHVWHGNQHSSRSRVRGNSIQLITN